MVYKYMSTTFTFFLTIQLEVKLLAYVVIIPNILLSKIQVNVQGIVCVPLFQKKKNNFLLK